MAATTTFAIPELLADILVYFDMNELLKLELVSTAFKDTIRSAPKLKEITFAAICTDLDEVMMITSEDEQLGYLRLGYNTYSDIEPHPLFYRTIQRHHRDGDHRANKVAGAPEFVTITAEDPDTNENPKTTFKTTFYSKADARKIFAQTEHSYSRMYITQPSLETLCLVEYPVWTLYETQRTKLGQRLAKLTSRPPTRRRYRLQWKEKSIKLAAADATLGSLMRATKRAVLADERAYKGVGDRGPAVLVRSKLEGGGRLVLIIDWVEDKLLEGLDRGRRRGLDRSLRRREAQES